MASASPIDTPSECPHREPAAAAPTSCARCRITRHYTRTPKARCWSTSATRACCARRASKKACRRSCAARAKAGSPPNTACCRARPTRARDREAARGKQCGRTQEIQRLIGRALRACVDLAALGERTIRSTATCCRPTAARARASITGAYVALADAVRWCSAQACSPASRCSDRVAAVSVGVFGGEPVLDLDYAEDCGCDTDMNVVMNDGGGFIELQGTAEGHAVPRDELDALLDLAEQRHRASCSPRSARRWTRVTVGACTCRDSSSQRQRRASSRVARRLLEPLATRRDRAVASSASPTSTSRTRPSSRTRCEGAPCVARDRPARARRRLRPRASTRSAARPACIRRATPASHDDRDARNIAKLLAALRRRRRPARAHFLLRARAAAHADDPQPLIAEGSWRGRDPRRAARRGGFGYDPLFSTCAHRADRAPNSTPHARTRCSHRGQALRSLSPGCETR